MARWLVFISIAPFAILLNITVGLRRSTILMLLNIMGLPVPAAHCLQKAKIFCSSTLVIILTFVLCSSTSFALW